MWPPCPCACRGWQVARGWGDAVRQRELQLCLHGGQKAGGGIRTLVPKRFGVSLLHSLSVLLESDVQRPSSKQAL